MEIEGRRAIGLANHRSWHSEFQTVAVDAIRDLANGLPTVGVPSFDSRHLVSRHRQIHDVVVAAPPGREVAVGVQE